MPSELKDIEMFTAKEFAKIDVSKHEGKREKIELVTPVDSFTSYNEEGELVPGLKRPVQKVKIATGILETITNSDGTKLDLRAQVFFNLKKKVIDGKEHWGVSKHQKSKLYQFMKKQKVETLEQLKGTLVTVTTKPSNVEGDEREFLTFAV